MQDAIGVEIDFRYLVRNQDDGNALVGELTDDVVNALLVTDVDARRGAVEDEDLGVGSQPFRQNDALLIAARQRLDGSTDIRCLDAEAALSTQRRGRSAGAAGKVQSRLQAVEHGDRSVVGNRLPQVQAE